MSNATVDKAVTFSTFPAKAHNIFATQTQQKPLPQVTTTTEIHANDIQKPQIEELFGCLRAKTFAHFPTFKGLAGGVFRNTIVDKLDLDQAHDKLQEFLSSQLSLTEGTKRRCKTIDDLITTSIPLNRMLGLIRGCMGQYAKA